MQVSVENVGKLARKLTVKVPAEQVEARVRERLRELGQTVRLKGFRPGKVPSKVIEQRFGQQVRNEAMSDVIGKSFQDAVRQENLRPAVSPSIQAAPAAGSKEIEYTATFEVMPEIGGIDVSTLSITRPAAAVEEADIDAMIETLRQQRRQWHAVERAAGPGDMVLFEYSAVADGLRHPASGLERAGTIIGSGALFAEFEQALVGVGAGGEKQVALTFPANFREAALAGKSAQVQIKIVRIQEGRLPSVDEQFAAAFGITEGGVAKFREDVRANLQRELTQNLHARVKTDAVDKLVAAYQDLELPQGLIDIESRNLLAQAKQNAERAGVTPPADASLFTDMARRRVLAYVLLTEVGRQQKIALDQRKLNDMLATIASTYEEPEKVVELYARDQELMNNLRNRVLEDQVIDWVVDHARVTEEKLSFDQVMKARAGQ
jgi:trigger factor